MSRPSDQSTMSIFLPDAFGTFLEINPQFICYRNRVIDVHAISTYQTKSRKVTINTFKQNLSLPTMCVWFKTGEDAKNAVATLTSVIYGVVSECPCVNPEPESEGCRDGEVSEPCEALAPIAAESASGDLNALCVVSVAYVCMIFVFNMVYFLSRASRSSGSGDEL
jgi:hypothetical protein